MGLIIAVIIITGWLTHLSYILIYSGINFSDLVFYLHILIQAQLYTGLFITAHDAMHSNIVKSGLGNKIIGNLSALLYAALSYKKLLKNHFYHHKYPGTKSDPDFLITSQNFLIWWFTFLSRYATIFQMVLMAFTFNILKIWITETKLLLFWILPVFLSSIQLFYFGTYIPHRLPHNEQMTVHHSRTLGKNHFFAFLSCYFFGYHLEHHLDTAVPWWKLYKTK